MNGHNFGEIPRFIEELAYLRGLNAGIVIRITIIKPIKEKI